MSDPIHASIEEAAGVSRKDYPLTHGCPFPEGALKDAACVRILGDGGDELPLQTTVQDALWALPTFEKAGLLEVWRDQEI